MSDSFLRNSVLEMIRHTRVNVSDMQLIIFCICISFRPRHDTKAVLILRGIQAGYPICFCVTKSPWVYPCSRFVAPASVPTKNISRLSTGFWILVRLTQTYPDIPLYARKYLFRTIPRRSTDAADQAQNGGRVPWVFAGKFVRMDTLKDRSAEKYDPIPA